MNSKKQASEIKLARTGVGQPGSSPNRKMGERNHGMKKGIKPTLFQLISSYVIRIKNICLQVRALSVGKRLLKKLHSSLVH